MNEVDTFLSEWSDAERNGDGTGLEALLTDDFLGVGPLGFVLPKSIWVQRFDQFGLDYETFDLDEVQTRVHGEAALVTARQTARGTAGGNPVPEAVRATLALVAESGRWRLAGIHKSFIAGTPPLPGAPE
jgi:ketosteroid isomerase-like protein